VPHRSAVGAVRPRHHLIAAHRPRHCEHREGHGYDSCWSFDMDMSTWRELLHA
jgi:hypothetical protein